MWQRTKQVVSESENKLLLLLLIDSMHCRPTTQEIVLIPLARSRSTY